MAYRAADVRDFALYPVDFANWLIRERFVPGGPFFCGVCNSSMRLERTPLSPQHRSASPDFGRSAEGVIWRCPQQSCRHTQSIRIGSIFEASHYTIPQQFELMEAFCNGFTVEVAANAVGVDRRHVGEYFGMLRQRWQAALNARPITFDADSIHESDEMVLLHVKDETSGQYRRQWIQSLAERESGKVKLFIIPDRSADVLIGNIRNNIPPQSMVFTDEWPAYANLGRFHYNHRHVNHSRREYSRRDRLGHRLVDVHINTCEAHHRHFRKLVANRQLKTLQRLPAYIGEYEFRCSGYPLYAPFKLAN